MFTITTAYGAITVPDADPPVTLPRPRRPRWDEVTDLNETQPIADGPGQVTDRHPWDGPPLHADERHDSAAVTR